MEKDLVITPAISFDGLCIADKNNGDVFAATSCPDIASRLLDLLSNNPELLEGKRML